MNFITNKGETMKTLLMSLLICGTILSMTSGTARSKELVLAGSTTIQKRVIEPTAAAVEAATGIKVTVLGIGTGPGFQKLLAGEVTASLASSPLHSILAKNNLPDDGVYKEHIIIKDVIVPIVHVDNPVSTLTWEQLTDINAGKITNWKEVGGPDLPIRVVTSHSGAATRVVFQEEVMKNASYVANAMQVTSTREEVDLVAKLKGGIGAVSEGFVAMYPGKVKVLKTTAIERPLSIITKGEASPDVKAIITFLKTAEAQKLFK